MAGIALTGLASGMDTDAIISQLIAAESSPRTQLNQQQLKAEKRVSVLQELQGKLTSLKTATQALRSAGSWANVQTVSTSDSARLGARMLGGAAPGTYSVETLKLASAAQRTFSYTPPAAAETLSIGNFSLTVQPGMSLDDIVAEINQSDNGLVAVNAQGKLVVSSTTTGAASGFAWSGAMLGQESERLGADAEYRIDGGAVQTSAKNVVEHGLPGVELSLSKVGTTELTVSPPGPDTEALTGRLKSFVEAYNAVSDAARLATAEQPVKDPKNNVDLTKGVLFGDSSLVRLSNSLRTAIGTEIAGAGLQLADLGISTGDSTGTINNDAVSGRLVFDEAKAKEAIARDPEAVRELLGGVTGIPGVSQQLDQVVLPATDVESGIGSRIESVNTEIKRIKDSLVRFDDRLSRRETALRAQFGAMELALSRSQAQQAELTSQLSALLAQSAG